MGCSKCGFRYCVCIIMYGWSKVSCAQSSEVDWQWVNGSWPSPFVIGKWRFGRVPAGVVNRWVMSQRKSPMKVRNLLIVLFVFLLKVDCWLEGRQMRSEVAVSAVQRLTSETSGGRRSEARGRPEDRWGSFLRNLKNTGSCRQKTGKIKLILKIQ